MAERVLPPVDLLGQLLRYEAETGFLFWKTRSVHHFNGTPLRSAEHTCANWNARYAGTRAFTHIGTHGYHVGNLNNRTELAHRIIMAMHRGAWDFEYVDHINGNQTDNRIVNLRVATNAENIANSRPRRGSSSKYLGVAKHTQNGNWMAGITKGGVTIYLGVFDDEQTAARAYDVAAREMHGQFARLNFP